MKSNKGFIGVPRAIFSSTYWNTERKFTPIEAYLDLLQMATFGNKPKSYRYKQQTILLQPGEFIASRTFLQDRWQWSDWIVRTFLDKLLLQQFLQQKRRYGVTILCVNQSLAFGELEDTDPLFLQQFLQKPNKRITNNKETETIVSDKKAPTDQQATLFSELEAPAEAEILPTEQAETSEPADITPQPADITTHVARPRTTKAFQPPTVFEVEAYCMQKHYDLVNPQRFVAYYESIGWIVGGHIPMKSWRGAVAGWQCREAEKQKALAQQSSHLLTNPNTNTNPLTPNNHENSTRIAANPAATTTTTTLHSPRPLSATTGTKADACAQALECYAARESRYLAQMDGEEPDF